VDPRLLVLALFAAGLTLAWLIHRLIERPASRLLRTRLNESLDRMRTLREA
jgi:peptidoglycan/LPS O-acetylase OafA/YrhL